MNKWTFRLGTLWRYRDLIRELIVRDIKLKYRRSFLGYVWSVLNPLLIMIVMTVVFSAMFKRNIENFPVYLLTGRMTFDFMRQSTTNAMSAVTKNAPLLKKTYIPKYIFTLAKVSSCFLDFIFSLGALAIVMIVTRSRVYPTVLLTPYVILQLYLFCLGLGFLLGALNVFFRDILYIYNAVLTAWTYLTPLFYPIEALPNNLQVVIKFANPMYYYVASMRDLVLYGRLPGPRLFWGGWIFAIGMCVLGIYVFDKNKDRFILYI